MTIVKRSRYEDTETGFVYRFRPIDGTVTVEKTKTGYEARYLIVDDEPENPFEDWDGNGAFSCWANGGDELDTFCKLLGYNRDTREQTGEEHSDAVRIDKYEHGGIVYSVNNEGRNCRWDTSKNWAVWFPDDCLLGELKTLTEKKRREKVIEHARRACKLFNQWANGDVYCLVKETYNADKNPVDYDVVGGYYGIDYAMEALKTEI